MDTALLFQPLRIGNVEIKNRISMSPMDIYGLSTSDGGFSERAIDYYVERAKGGVGLIITGLVKVENEIEHFYLPSDPCATHKPFHFIATASELTERIHAYGAKIFLQLTAGFGRVGSPSYIAGQPVAPSAVPNYWEPEVTCRELTTQEVETIVKKFGEAAKIAVKCGFDGVEIHALHEGYLLDQFAVAFFNKRTDKYGGDLKARLTFTIEILKEIKRCAGKDFPVQMRLSLKSFIKDWGQGGLPGEEFLERGRDLEEGLEVARILEQAGYDSLNADVGSYEGWYWPHPPGYQEHGCYLPYTTKLKQTVKIPVLVAGRLELPEIAVKALAEEGADVVSLGRGLLADPYWPNKVLQSKTENVRPCLGCYDGCLNREDLYKPLCCAVNPATGRERQFEIQVAPKQNKVLIAGGGIAGLEAARVAATRGHQVTLYEKTTELGGHILEASVPSFKKDEIRLLQWYKNQLTELQVKIHKEQAVTPELIQAENPDVVFVATGSKPIKLMIPGIDRENVTTATDLLLGNHQAGSSVAIVGGGLVGCETALWLAQADKKVIIIESAQELMSSGQPVFHSKKKMLLDLLRLYQVEILTNSGVVEILDQGIVVMDKQFHRNTVTVDTVVLAIGFAAENELYRQLSGKVPEIYAIGDAQAPRNIMHAIWSANEVARNI